MSRERNHILQRRYELNYYGKVKKAIQSRISSLISVIKENGIHAGVSYLSKQTHSGELHKVIEDIYLKVGLRFARMQWSEFMEQKRAAKDWGVPGRRVQTKETNGSYATNGGTPSDSLSNAVQTKGFGFNSAWVEWIKNYLYRFLLDKIVFKVAETTREVLMSVLDRAISNGWGIAETVKELEDLPLSKNQAARIVRTEVTRAANAGTMAAGSTFEFEQKKEWLAAHDLRTRGTDPDDHASHVDLDGTVIDYDDHFIDPRNGDRLLFPGDPKASAASTINCRCSVAITAKRDLNGRLIPKREKIKELVEQIEEKMDLTEILQPVYDLAKDVNSLRREVSEAKAVKAEVDLTVIEKELTDRTVEIINRVNSSNDEVLDSVALMIKEIPKSPDHGKKIDELIKIVESKEYTPRIEVSTDSLVVIQNIEEMKRHIVAALVNLKTDLAKKRNYHMVINRNSNDLMTSIEVNEK